MTARYVDAVYCEGKIELLDPVALPNGTHVRVLIEGDEVTRGETTHRQVAQIKRMRGAFKGSLSSSEAFSRRKAEEKVLER